VRVRRLFTRLLLTLAVLTTVAILTLWVEHSRTLELPALTGTFPVGRTVDHWQDQTLWIWYPAATPGPADDYLPEPIRRAWQQQRPAFINFLTRDLAKVRAHAARDVAVSPVDSAYPVVIFRGGGAGSALSYTSLEEDLASHGYVVVGLEMPVMKNPELCDGRPDAEACATEVMTPLIAGIGRAIDRLRSLSTDDPRFKGRFDFTRIGVFGHSFGGAQAAQFCAEDSRCKAGVNIDGRPFGTVVQTGIHVPFLTLLGDHTGETDPESLRIMSQIQSIYDRQPADSRAWATIQGAAHFTFSDDGALLKSGLFRAILRLMGRLHVAGRRQVEITAYAVRTFFDAYLKGPQGRTRPLVLASSRFPELVVQR
jgi:predicted dienelactone hydrolase